MNENVGNKDNKDKSIVKKNASKRIHNRPFRSSGGGGEINYGRLGRNKVNMGETRNPVVKMLKLANIDVKNGSVAEIEKCKNKEYAEMSIVGNYRHDINILKIHKQIVGWFRWMATEHCKELETKILEVKNGISKNQTVIQRKKSLSLIQKCKESIEKINKRVDYNNYKNKSMKYLIEYKNMGTIPEIISFENKIQDNKIISTEDKTVQTIRHKIINKYLDVVRRYVPVEIYREYEPLTLCTVCQAPIEEATEDVFGNLVCKCGYEEVTVKKTMYHKDKSRVSSSRNNYDDGENFRKALERFQGTQNNKPPIYLYEELDSYFISRNFPIGEEIQKLPLDQKGEKKGTSRNLMYDALSFTGNSGFYEDINLILHVYWGWELPDITHIKDIIMGEYELSQSVYEELPKERKSSLNSQFRLLKHLLRHKDSIKYDIRVQDFKIPSTRDIIEWHEQFWEKMCTVLRSRGHKDWINIPII